MQSIISIKNNKIVFFSKIQTKNNNIPDAIAVKNKTAAARVFMIDDGGGSLG